MIQRQRIGDPVEYRDHRIEVAHMGPDLLALVDGEELPNFYIDAESARNAARRHIDQTIKEKE